MHSAGMGAIPIFLQYVVDCSLLSSMPIVTFTINGIPYTLSAQAYTLMVPTAPTCWVPRTPNPPSFSFCVLLG